MDEQTPRFAVEEVCSLQEEAFVEREGERSFSALVFSGWTLSGWSAKGVLCFPFDTYSSKDSQWLGGQV